MRNKKGFTIVETVVALAVLAIISVAVLGTAMVVNKLNVRATERTAMGYAVESAVECFYNTNTAEAFLEETTFCMGLEAIEADGDYYYYFLAGKAVSAESDYSYVMKIRWTASAITLGVVSKNNKTLIEEATYRRV